MRRVTIEQHLSRMRRHVLVLALFVACAAIAQTSRSGGDGARAILDARDLTELTTTVPGQGLEVPGMDLADIADQRHALGDGPQWSERAFIDTSWVRLRASLDSALQEQGTHWVRFHLNPDRGLKDVQLVLRIGVRAPFEVFLNGRSLMHVSGIDPQRDPAGWPLSDSLLCTELPLTFLCDERPEVIAVRVDGRPGRSLTGNRFEATLHLSSAGYTFQRRLVHFGVFIGVNVIIFILALVIWNGERRDKSWPLLALLSLVSALDTFCEVGNGLGAFGFAGEAWRTLGFIQTVLLSWPLYLLIMVLGVLRGDLSRRRMKWYTISVVLVTFICIGAAVCEAMGLLDSSEGLVILNDSPVLITVVIVLALVSAAVVVWFAFDVIRLGIRLLRSKGYARWIGGGALASMLLTLVLKVISSGTGLGLSAWLQTLADYCSYVAVPVSVAIYLAIRSAHHNRLVARQRDELDEEVKERTAELRSERDRSEELLLNILPAEVADELKRTGAAAAKHFDLATVMFTDFKGFTAMSEQVTPAELLHELNACFKAFDDIIDAHGVEKIKTIGDAYMCVGGLPDPSASTPADVVHAALEMQAFMELRKQERMTLDKPFFEMRLGIHTGPVVAGIVGVKKFQYDIWGDTVNTASRMESSGEVGQVNISESTYVLVKNEQGLSFTSRGKVQAKGKGEMEMYFAHGASVRST